MAIIEEVKKVTVTPQQHFLIKTMLDIVLNCAGIYAAYWFSIYVWRMLGCPC